MDLIGGDGVDVASYDNSSSAVAVNLTTGTSSGGDGADTFSSIEGVNGSDFADSLTGDGGANTLFGSADDDVLDGVGGADQLIGDRGIDTAYYGSAASGVVLVDLGGKYARGRAGNDTLEDVENVVGSAFNDTLTAMPTPTPWTAAPETTCSGAVSAMTILSAAPAPIPCVSYSAARAGITANLAAGTASGEGSDTLSGVENPSGSRFSDTLTGDSADNWLEGGADSDTLNGGDGNDTLKGGTSNDTLIGGGASTPPPTARPRPA